MDLTPPTPASPLHSVDHGLATPSPGMKSTDLLDDTPNPSKCNSATSSAAEDKRQSSSSAKKTKTHVGPWRLGRTLGRGSSGRVRLAKHTTTGRLAAVKIVPKSMVADDIEKAPYGIEREVIIMKLIEHPNVMALYDVWENKGELYLVLEYIEGGELFDYLIQKGRLEEREAVNYFRQIIYGVDYCHKFNICHRDLKPENLLLDKHRNIKIADFGMAALETPEKLLETSCGSPHYASPEIVAGKTYHGGPSDIWSCGIILFALLTGHLPFDDDNIRKLLLKVQDGKFVMPEELSPLAKDLIWRMLRVDPDSRITMPEILDHPLLTKYPARHSQKIPNVSADFVRRPVARVEDIDPEILKNLQTLWHGATQESVIEKLLSPEHNSEKTFYCLLIKYRHDHNEEPSPKPKRKSSSSAGAKTSHRTPTKTPAYMARHRRTTSSSSRSRSRSQPRSRSASRSHSRIIYPHNRSASIASRSSFSKYRVQSSSSVRRTRSVNSSVHGSRQSTPPPPLPVEAVKMVEAELSNQETTRTSEFASMLEQAFNFDTNYYASTPRSTRVSEYHTPSQFEDPPSPTLESHDILYTSSPAPQPSFLLPRIFEEDRFADAVEEEMELHMKRSLEGNMHEADYVRTKARRAEPPRRAERWSLPAQRDQMRFNVPAVTPTRKTSDSFAVESSRLHISELIKTDSFKAKTERPKFGDIQTSPPFAYNAKFTMTASLQMPSNRPRIDYQPIITKPLIAPPVAAASTSAVTKPNKVPNKRHSTPVLEKPRVKVAPRLSDPPKVTEKLSMVSEDTGAKPFPPPPSRKKSLLKKLSLVPKRAAPPPPIDENRVVSNPATHKSGSSASRRYSNAQSTEEESSGSTPVVPKQNWFMKMLNGRSETKGFYSPLSAPVLRRMIILILSEWQQYGISNISEDSSSSAIRAKISSRNVLSLRSSKFRIEIESQSVRPARTGDSHITSIIIVRERGSSNTFLRFLGEMERTLEERDALIRQNDNNAYSTLERESNPLGIFV